MSKDKSKQPEPGPANPSPSGKVELLALMLVEGYDGPACRGSVDLTSRAGKRFFLNAQKPPTFQPDQLRGKVFRLCNWLAEVRSYHDDETGEDRRAVSVTFIDPAGKTCRFGSEAITRTFDVLRTLYGDGPFEEPIYLKIEPYRTRNARNSYTMEEVDPADVTPEQKTW